MRSLIIHGFFSLLITICSSLDFISIHNLKLSANSFVNRKIKSTAPGLIWLSQITDDITSPKSAKYFVRTWIVSSVNPLYQTISDLKAQLSLQAFQQQYLNCAVFKNKTDSSYTLYKFGTTPVTDTKGVTTYYNKYEIDQQVINIGDTIEKYKISTDCTTLLINATQIAVRFDAVKGFGYSPFYWVEIDSWEDQAWVLFDDNFDSVLTNDSLYYHIFDSEDYDFGFEMWVFNQSINFAQKMNLSNYTTGKTFFYNETVNGTYQRRSILFSQRQTQFGYEQFMQIVIQYNQTDLFVFFNQTLQFKTKPEIRVNDQCTHAIIHGTATNGSHVYYGYFTSYDQNNDTGKPEALNITWRDPVVKYDNYLVLTDTMLYVRNKAVSGTALADHSAYVLSQNKLFPFFEKVTINQSYYGNTYWVQTAIIPLSQPNDTFSDKKMILQHLYLYFPNNYVKLDTISSLNQVFQAQFNTMFQTTSSLPSSTTSVSQVLSGFSWIYSAKNQVKSTNTDIHILKYDEQVKNTKMIHITTTMTDTQQIIGFSQNLDCVCTFNSVAKKLTFSKATVKVGGTITALTPTIDYTKNISAIKLTVGDNCGVIKFDSEYYLLNNLNVLETITASVSKLKSPEFDSSYQFAVSGTKLYQLSAAKTYVEVLDSTFLGTNYISLDQKRQKMIIVTKDTQLKIKVFYLSSSKWYQIPQILFKTLKIGDIKSTIQVSDSFNRVGICYIGEVPTDNNKTQNRTVCRFKTIDYTTKLTLQDTYTLDQGYQLRQMNVLDKSIHIIETYFDKLRNRTVDCQYIVLRNYTNGTLYAAQTNSIDINYLSYLSKRLYYEFPGNDSYYYIDSTWTVKNSAVSAATLQASATSLSMMKLSAGTDTSTTAASATAVKLMKSAIVDPTAQTTEVLVDNQKTGFYTVNGTVYQCSTGCAKCTNSSLCNKCAPGFGLDINTLKCVRCSGICQSCSAFNVSDCIICRPGFFYDKNKTVCIQCHSLCNSCTGSKDLDCKTCLLSYFLNTAELQPLKRKTCLPCPSNCEVCFNSTRCRQCSFGYSNLPNGTCVRCPLNCMQCNASEVRTCLSCKTGFQMVTFSEVKLCQKCPDFCETCLNSICSKCRDKYILDKSNNTCGGYCISPCLTCKSNNPSACRSCISGYIYSNKTQKCTGDVNCSKTASCRNCPMGYVLVSKKCEPCSTTATSFCNRCSPDDPAKCMQCQRGYYLDDDSCLQCSSDCDLCFSASICQSCSSGNMLTASSSSASKCVSCAKYCTICVNSTTNCLACEDGYNLQGSVCLSQKTIDYLLKLDIDWEKYINDVNFNILRELAAFTGKPTTSIRIKSISKGSVVVAGSVDVQNATDQKSVLGKLKTSYSDGTTIGGVPIINSQFVGYTPESATPEDNKMLIIIIAAVVPSVLVVLGITGCLIYRKFFAPPPKQPQVHSDKSQTQTQGSTKSKSKRKSRSRKSGFHSKGKIKSSPNI